LASNSRSLGVQFGSGEDDDEKRAESEQLPRTSAIRPTSQNTSRDLGIAVLQSVTLHVIVSGIAQKSRPDRNRGKAEGQPEGLPCPGKTGAVSDFCRALT
jgi:hypothetical protein